MIYLVRQGQTDWNLFKRFNGCTETYLNQTGIKQAEQQSKALKDISFDVCFCSPQKRAIQTCEIIYKEKTELDKRLAEINCGEFEGTEETVEAMKLFWQSVMKGDKGTESFKNFLKRNCDFCNMLMDKHRGKNILIVTHAANARVINYYFSGKPETYDFRKAIAKNGEFLAYENS